MAFTYDDALDTDRDYVRFYLNDTVKSSGPRPTDANFTDEEIDGLVTLEGSWRRAVAGGYERLATEWLRFPTFQADGLRLDRSAIAKGYREQAATWRRRYGSSGGGAGTRAVTRVDGYSSDKDNVTT